GWRRAGVRRSLAAAGSRVRFGIDVPAIIDGREARTTSGIPSVDPASPTTTVATSASCGRAEADEALAAARRAWPAWARTPAGERAAVLFRAAEWLRARRADVAALEVFEAGRPWREADADVCEAIDVCEYSGREAPRLAAGGVVESPPGESNV